MSLPYVDSINLIALRSLVKSMAYEMQQVTHHLSAPHTSVLMEDPSQDETIDFFGTQAPETEHEPQLEPQHQHDPPRPPREERSKYRRKEKRREVKEPHEGSKETSTAAAKEPIPQSKTAEEVPKSRFQRRERRMKNQASVSAAPAQVTEEASAEAVSPPDVELVDITALERQLLASPEPPTEKEVATQVEVAETVTVGDTKSPEEPSKERKKKFRRGSKHYEKHSVNAELGPKADKSEEMTPVVGRQEPQPEVATASRPTEQPVTEMTAPASTAEPTLEPQPQQMKPRPGGHYFRGERGQRRDRVEGKENRRQTRRPHQTKGPATALQPPPQRNQ